MSLTSVAPPVAEAPRVFRPRPGLAERTIIVFLILINQFGTPVNWFQENTGSASGVDSDILLSYGSFALVIVLVFGLVGNGNAAFKTLAVEPMLALYLFAIGLSPVWASDFANSLTKVVNLGSMVGLAIILLVRFRPTEIIQLSAVAFAIGIMLDLFWVIAMGPLGRSASGWDGIGTQKNALGNHGVLGVIIFLLAARIFRRFRVPLYLLFIASMVLLVGSQSKTSLAAGMITAGSMVVFLAFRARKTLAGAVFITLATGSIASVLFATANIGVLARWLDKDVTLTGRTPLWSATLTSIREQPWLGFGYEGFFGGPLSDSHRITASEQFDWAPTHAHNAILQSALHVGIIFTILFVLLNLRSLVRATEHIRMVRGPIGLFPLVYLTLITMTSFTESGVFTQRFGWALFIIAIVQAKVGVDEAKQAGVIPLDEEREIAEDTLSGPVSLFESIPQPAKR